MSNSIVLTVVCDDHPGIVESLSQVLADHGANWAESSMMSLAGKFAGILLVQVPKGGADDLVRALENLESEGMQIVAQRTGGRPPEQDHRGYVIDLVGQDHPGIVHDITEVLARHAINVQELETTIQSASMSGEHLFIAHAKIAVPPEVALESLREELEALANELMVDISLRDD
jgi:glycine cleavage system regulatory protein